MKEVIKKLMEKRINGEIDALNFNFKLGELVVANISKMLKLDFVPSLVFLEDNEASGNYVFVRKEIGIDRQQFLFNFAFNRLLADDEDGFIEYFSKSISTLCHECRHAWQDEYGLYNGVKYVSYYDRIVRTKLLLKYSEEEAQKVHFEMYYAQPCEVDARYWAEKKVKEMKERVISPFDFLEGLDKINWSDQKLYGLDCDGNLYI